MNNIKMLSSLLFFAEVAKQQSFTLAAKQLGMSKSAISQQVKRLEAHIGQQLLSRHTRGMSLTAAGEKLLVRCELLRDQVDLAFEELSNSKDTPSGSFSITLPHTCEQDIVIPALTQLCLEFHKIEPHVMVTDEARDLIQDNLDVAIYGGELKDSNYRALPIGTMSEYYCASPGYVQKYGDFTTPEALAQHRLIATPWQTPTYSVYKNSDLSEKIPVCVKYSASANTLPSVIEMVMGDMGVALLPDIVASNPIASGQLVRVLENYQGKQWPFYMVHRFQGEKPIHITRFYQLVKHYFAKANNFKR